MKKKLQRKTQYKKKWSGLDLKSTHIFQNWMKKTENIQNMIGRVWFLLEMLIVKFSFVWKYDRSWGFELTFNRIFWISRKLNFDEYWLLICLASFQRSFNYLFTMIVHMMPNDQLKGFSKIQFLMKFAINTEYAVV